MCFLPVSLVYLQQKLLGRIRKEFAQHLNMNGRNIFGDRMEFLWIIDFPLFEKSNDQLGINSVHHPFTAPHPDDLHLLETSPLQVNDISVEIFTIILLTSG